MSFDKNINPMKLHHLVGDMEADYIYTPGVAGDKFFKALRDEGKLLATSCETCKITYLPPRMYCERCFSELDKWIEAESSGVVDSFTLVHEDRDGKKLPEPVLVAFIRIDNTDGGLIHKLGGVDLDAAKIGMTVKAVLKDKSKRTGGLTDIDHFAPE
ncbi:MAG: Zn-ribbon domain-containing OB-fold protein [Candidatus Thorarchaeota archaeon]|nr:MAG: Zn-ribbon domain-containing OB-fold protein [Candidatus Thorarchaeota archaeon]